MVGVGATRPKCVPNRLVCHTLSSRDMKAVNSLCICACVRAARVCACEATVSACSAKYVTLCNERACALNYHTGCSLGDECGL